MKNLALIILLATFSCLAFGQKKSKIIDKGISNIKTYEQRLDKGIDTKFIIKEESYNQQGNLIELRETSRKGEIKLWEKYKYDDNGNLIEEIHYDLRGKIEKRIVTKFRDNLKIEREYYDSDGRLYKKRSYEYQFD